MIALNILKCDIFILSLLVSSHKFLILSVFFSTSSCIFMASCWKLAKQNSLFYGSNPKLFLSKLAAPPLNPMRDETPICRLNIARDFLKLLLDLIEIFKVERFDGRKQTLLENFSRWFPKWRDQQPSSVLKCYTFRTPADIRGFIRNVIICQFGDPSEEYVEYQQQWQWIQTILIAMDRKSLRHHQNVFYSGMWYSVNANQRYNARGDAFLPKCYVLPSIQSHVAAQNATKKKRSIDDEDDHDVRSYYSFDPSCYGGRKQIKTWRPSKRCTNSDAAIFLGAVPQCSQEVLVRQRQRQRKKVNKKKTLKHYYKSIGL